MKRVGPLLWSIAFNLYGHAFKTPPVLLVRFVDRIGRRLVGRRDVALRNLRLAYPERAESDLCRIEQQSWHQLVRTYLEIPSLSRLKPDVLLGRVEFINVDLLTDRRIEAQGALFLSAHCGNWELVALAAGLITERKMSIITRRQNDFGYLKEMRRRFGNSTIDADGRVRDIYRSLQSGEIVALLPDQAAPESDLHAELFGINAPVHSSPARLAQLFGPIVIVGFATSRPRGRYRVELHELDYDDLKQGEFDRHEFMQRYYNLLEQHLRSHPSDWVWHHRRWKNIQGLYDASS